LSSCKELYIFEEAGGKAKDYDLNGGILSGVQYDLNFFVNIIMMFLAAP
jgi:hypothetical protein